MNITDMLGQPIVDHAESVSMPESRCSPPAALEQEPEPGRATFGKAWVAILITLALGIGFGLGRFVTPSAPSTDPLPDLRSVALAPIGVTGTAEMFAALHLTGLARPEDMASLSAVGPRSSAATGTWINHSAAIAAESVGPHVWKVTIAVDALEMEDGAYESVGLQYYDITVDASADLPVAVSMPARVPRPSPAPQSDVIPAFTGDAPPDQLSALTGFFEAHLTGNGDVARYVSATARIPSFDHPPYQSIAIREIGADSVGRVEVTIDAATTRSVRHQLQYIVETSLARGVWEVSQLSPVVHQ